MHSSLFSLTDELRPGDTGVDYSRYSGVQTKDVGIYAAKLRARTNDYKIQLNEKKITFGPAKKK